MDEPKIKDFVPLAKLRRIVKNLRNSPDDMEVTFEYLMTACFPTIFYSIRDTMKDCYTEGYKQGLEDARNANQGDSV